MEHEYVDNWEAQVKKGILSFIVLNILSRKHFYGYELMDEIQRVSSYNIAEGTLYPLLDRLKKDGLVTSEWVHQPTGVPRKYYYITKAGVTTLEIMNKHWLSLSSSINKVIRKNS
jgi:PadR family transcriptional regulator, regulatory protein PadR